ncbi:MAG: hypothetical protein KGJ23_12300 [Euryarchaeota archaeon]|nr:hypothetical protein [Euryarchaeota archaeon]MDE1837378.1 hypothetical protein [Euryarchaeota archaeon]MDE1881828.1 hypothetical protein [Euryarchaeota archaeon]MDE2046669.1 hypothetical protein [Thermoplasmata archaeon]
MATDRLSSIPAHAHVIERLQKLKTANQTWDRFLLDMAEDYLPPGWYEEMERRRGSGVDVRGSEVLRRSRAQAKKGY